jgi:hypothetical protein
MQLTLPLKIEGAQLIRVQRINQGREFIILLFSAIPFEPSPSSKMLNAILTSSLPFSALRQHQGSVTVPRICYTK